MLHLYTLTTNYQKEIKKTIPLTSASKRIKSLGMNPTKEVKDVYLEIHNTLMKKLKMKGKKWKEILCCVHGLEE